MKHQGSGMDAGSWNRHYETAGQKWTVANPWVCLEMNGARAGKALDLGSGDGRHAVWLAERGWQVQAVDFAIIGHEIGARRAEAKRVHSRVTWTVADITKFEPVRASVEYVLISYLNLPQPQLQAVFAAAAAALTPGGHLMFINPDVANLVEGSGLREDTSMLQTPNQIAYWMKLTGLHIDSVETRSRAVPGERQPAIDCIILGTAPYSAALPVHSLADRRTAVPQYLALATAVS